MKYTKEMFGQDFKDTYCLNFDSFNYEYFIALEEIPKWDGKWGSRQETYLVKNAKTGKCVWIYFCNVQKSVKENEVFIGGVYKSLHRYSVSVCRPTGVFTFKRKSNLKRKVKIAQYVNKVCFKRERPIYDWYEKELDKVNKELKKAYRDMDYN
jgi:hypothetical protein